MAAWIATPDRIGRRHRSRVRLRVQRGAQMRVGREWIDGRGDLPDLLHNRARHARGGELGDLEAGFLSTIDAAGAVTVRLTCRTRRKRSYC